MEILYRAVDGHIFLNEDDCYTYESTLTHQNLFTIEFFNEKDNRYFIRRNNIFDEDVYNQAEKVIIHNIDELNDFKWLAEECGWCEFAKDGDIDSPGIWVRKETDWTHDGVWEKEK